VCSVQAPVPTKKKEVCCCQGVFICAMFSGSVVEQGASARQGEGEGSVVDRWNGGFIRRINWHGHGRSRWADT